MSAGEYNDHGEGNGDKIWFLVIIYAHLVVAMVENGLTVEARVQMIVGNALED